MLTRDGSFHRNDKGQEDYDPHVGRYVLGVGILLAIAALSAIWTTTAFID